MIGTAARHALETMADRAAIASAPMPAPPGRATVGFRGGAATIGRGPTMHGPASAPRPPAAPWQIAAATEREREAMLAPARLSVCGEIGSAKAVSAGAVRRFLATVRPFQRLHITLHTPGGSVGEAERIAALIGRHRGETCIHVPCHADSAGVIVLSAANRRSASESASFRLHFPAIDRTDAARLTAAALGRLAVSIAELDERLVDSLARRWLHPHQEIAALMQGETMLSAERALMLGLLHAVRSGEPGDRWFA